LDRDLRVCLMNDSFPPVIDGVANAVVNYAACLTKSRDSVMVATPSYPGAVDDYPFPVLRYPSFNTTKLVGYRTGYPFSAGALNTLEQAHFDVIHTHCPIVSTFLARLLRERTGAPVILTYHTKFDIDFANVIESDSLRRMALQALVYNVSVCDEVWTVSRGAGESLRALGYAGEYVVMENGTDMPKGRAPESETRPLLARAGLPGDAPVLLYVGRMMWYKGLRITLNALASLRASGVPFRMVFVGGGKDFDEIRAYAETVGVAGQCAFIGPVPHEELKGWYSAGDLFLFPSTFDTNGLVVREAAACGTPSVLVDGSCAAEGVTDGADGFLIRENAGSMAGKLRALLGAPETLRRVGETAMDSLVLSWEESVARAAARYRVVVENRLSRGASDPPIRRDRFFAAMGALLDSMEKLRRFWDNE